MNKILLIVVFLLTFCSQPEPLEKAIATDRIYGVVIATPNKQPVFSEDFWQYAAPAFKKNDTIFQVEKTRDSYGPVTYNIPLETERRVIAFYSIDTLIAIAKRGY